MRALKFDDRLQLVRDAPLPGRAGEALVKVLLAGICNTDLEITKGYAGFHGVLGHEFVGRVIEAPDSALIGRRVVGEINAGCDSCDLCRAGDSRHCATRSVLGIKGRDGAFAEYLSLPTRNLFEVPDSIPDEAALFVEPLAAANHILDAAPVNRSSSVAVIGDGKLAQLIIRVLAATGCSLMVVGRHDVKLEFARSIGARCFCIKGNSLDGADTTELSWDQNDVVIEASGSSSGLPLALKLVRPRGVIILKSTHHGETPVEMSPMVVNEVTIIGSRCGRFAPAIELLRSGVVDVLPLISARFPLEEGLRAFRRASEPDTLKVILEVAG
jgi:threonine dehydrogenase-like Zn-dependent dehydrogenase